MGRNTVTLKTDINSLWEFYRSYSFNYTTLAWL